MAKKIVTFIIMVVFMIGCYIIDSAAAEAKKGLSPTMSKVSEYIRYNSAGRRDPFLSILILTKQKIEKQKKRKRNPLENVDVTEIRLLGIVKKGSKYYASILLPDGKAFTITKGTTIGLYDGKVVDIALDRLVVREYVMDYRGRIKPKDTILKLRKEEE